jgi:toxin FitB
LHLGNRGTSVYTTSVNKAEILYGIVALPDGRRRAALIAAAEAMFAEELAGRVLPFNDVAADHYAEIVTARCRAGRPIEAFDALIAATALAAGADLATRDVGGFEGLGLTLIDPWAAAL